MCGYAVGRCHLLLSMMREGVSEQTELVGRHNEIDGGSQLDRQHVA